MKNIAIILTSVLIFFCAINVFADTAIKAEVDKTSITTDENITYKLTITSTEKDISTPQLPKFEGFNVISQTQSSTVSLVKNNIQHFLVYVYILAPKDTGKFNIESSQIKIEGKSYSSESFEIEVKQGKAKPQHKPEPDQGQQPSLPDEIKPEFKQPQITI